MNTAAPSPAKPAGADPAWPDDAIEVGRIVDAWGLKGWIKVQPFASDPQALFSSRRWFILPSEKAGVTRPASVAGSLPTLLKITQVKDHGEVVVALAQEVPDRSAAEAMRGARVFIGRASFPSAGEDEFYWIDLIGLNVVNRDGAALGKVVGLIDTGPHSVLRVLPAGQTTDEADTAPAQDAERLIPFVGAYIDAVSLEARLITVDWGLDYEAMRFDVITLFPELFAPHLTQGITRRAFESGQVDVKLWQLRDFADNNYRRVDDRPYGGGPGMVMLVEPLERALAAVRAARVDAAPVVHFTPTGRRIDQAVVREFAASPGAILLCGRYEGIDQRFLDAHVDLELSLGDFVLSGGELPALALLDAVARLQDGVLGDAQSHQQDSFEDGLLEGPHYSRPEVLAAGGAARAVPAELLSGHHADIARWRRQQSLQITQRRRPDLIEAARAAGRLSPADELYLKSTGL